MSETVEYVRVPGVLYGARRREVSVRGLDKLAEFFYDKVLPKESRVEVLSDSFGLPRRVVEDVLAGLLRSNHALLDVGNAELRRLDRPEVRREHHLGDNLEIWQDEITGTFLPLRLVDRLRMMPPPANFRSLRPAAEQQFQSFLDAPDARVIEALRSVQPSIAEGELAGFVLDSFTEKERLEKYDIYLPIETATVENDQIVFVQDKYWKIPFWLLHEWSRLLAGATSEVDYSDTLDAEVMRAARATRTVRQESILITSRLDSQSARWLHAVREITLNRNRAAIGRLHDHRALLLKRMLSNDEIRFAPAAPDKSHLQEMWERSRAYMIVVSSGDSRREEILAATAGKKKSAQLIVVCKEGQQTADKELLIHPIHARIVPEMCLIDGVEARVGDLDLLLKGAPVIQMHGASALSPLVMTTLQQMSYDGGGWWVRRQLQLHRTEETMPSPEKAAVPVARALDALCAEIALFKPEDGGESSIGTDLWQRAQALVYEVEQIAEAAGASIVPVPAADQREMLREALEAVAESPRPMSIELIADDAPPNLYSGSWRSLFERANAGGARIHLVGTPKADDDTVSALRQLAAQINSALMTMSISARNVPPALIIDGRLVVIGGDSWFHRNVVANCCFLVESTRFAAELRSVAGI
jgi:hypothetical protein